MDWVTHVKQYQAKHPSLSYKQAMVAAKSSWATKKKPAKAKAQGGKGILSTIKRIVRNVKRVFFFPPNRLPGDSQKVFNKYKDAVVKRITVNRVPIYSIIEKALNFLSLGTFDAAKKDLAYDRMFHLSMVMHTDKGDLTVEKNERISIKSGSPKKGENISITDVREATVDEYLEKARKSMGDHKFFQYNAFENNCQDFIMGILGANGSTSPEAKVFIKQDAKTLLKKMPGFVGKISQAATDAAGKVSQVLTGQGRKKKVPAKPRKTVVAR